jgi:DNA-binding LacI/PurR family transcriptional regulator
VTTIAPPPTELGRLAMTTVLSRIKDGPSARGASPSPRTLNARTTTAPAQGRVTR